MPVFLRQTDISLLEIWFLDTNYDLGQCHGTYIHLMYSLCTIKGRNVKSDHYTFSEGITILNQEPLCVSAGAVTLNKEMRCSASTSLTL
jgi:hypothetical protein